MFSFTSNSNQAQAGNKPAFSFSLPPAPTTQPSFTQPQAQSSVGQQQPPVSFTAYPFLFIKQCYDPNNANYRFRTYFYNPVPNGNQQAVKPAGVDDRLYQQALADNPDPKCLCPVWANGFGELQQRTQWQDEQLGAQRAKTEEIQGRLSKLVRQQDLDLAAELAAIQRQNLKLTGRLIAIVRGLERARRAGQALTAAEEEIRLKLQGLLARLHQTPLDLNHQRSLAFQLQVLKEAGRLDALQQARTMALEDSDMVRVLEQALQQQQDSLRGLVDTIQRDLKDLDTMHFGYQIN